ncbi:TnpV protein [Paenibacillus athensensis]|uniref:TnpV protein n=1 Tax=Paenibacillus athensensis TaxID=1967502 RepID=UPI001E4894E4|nr:TnpV protein [Paenibacillus athensensis]
MPIGKYGMLRKTYLQTQRKGLYTSLMLSEELYQHLTEIDRTARTHIEQTMQELLNAHPAPDKTTDPLAWTGHLNSLKQQAEELVLTELIYT